MGEHYNKVTVFQGVGKEVLDGLAAKVYDITGKTKTRTEIMEGSFRLIDRALYYQRNYNTKPAIMRICEECEFYEMDDQGTIPPDGGYLLVNWKEIFKKTDQLIVKEEIHGKRVEYTFNRQGGKYLDSLIARVSDREKLPGQKYAEICKIGVTFLYWAVDHIHQGWERGENLGLVFLFNEEISPLEIPSPKDMDNLIWDFFKREGNEPT